MEALLNLLNPSFLLSLGCRLPALMLGQGMRPDEVFRMTYENLDFTNRTICIV
jgi:integrase